MIVCELVCEMCGEKLEVFLVEVLAIRVSHLKIMIKLITYKIFTNFINEKFF